MVGPKTTKLIAILDELQGLLHELGHDHWAEWMQDSARRLRNSDFAGITLLLGAYGGMGSFNDILGEVVGEVPDGRVRRARRLRSEAWGLAEQIRHEAEIR